MLTTFITTLKMLVRDRTVLLWSIAFPLVLTTLFFAMFGNLDEGFKLKPIPVIVVDDAQYQQASTFSDLINSLSSDDANQGSPVLLPTFVKTEDAAKTALQDGSYAGYIQLDASGLPNYHQDRRQADSVGGAPNQSIVTSILDQYLQSYTLINNLITQDPARFANPEFVEKLTSDLSLSSASVASLSASPANASSVGADVSAGAASTTNATNTSNSSDSGAASPTTTTASNFTERLQVTANSPSYSLRFFYAVLAFSTIMMATFGLVALSQLQGNASPLGARRSLSGQSKLRTLMPTLAAAWLLSFACVLLGFLYQRLILNIHFGGQEPAVIATLAVSTLAFTFFGALLGSLKMNEGLKGGIVAFASCLLSMFAGLYGEGSAALGDLVARELPALSAANPVRQAADAFYSLYYYDSYEPWLQCLLLLAVAGALFFVAATLIMRRQRYASL